MHHPTIKKLASKASFRADLTNDSGSGRLTDLPDTGVLLSNGHWLVRIPDESWPTDLARFTGRDPNRHSNRKPSLEPCDPGDMPRFADVVPWGRLDSPAPSHTDSLALTPPTLPLGNGSERSKPILTVELQDRGGRIATPLKPTDHCREGLVLLNTDYTELIHKLYPGATFYTSGDPESYQNSAVVICTGADQRIVGILMPIKP